MVLVLVATSGIIIVRRDYKKVFGLIVSRLELTSFITMARIDAESSAETIAGDLSWLEEEKEILLETRKQRTGVKIKIFYDRKKVSKDKLGDIQQLEDAGVKLIPYPDGHTPALRCTILDRSSADGGRLFVYKRVFSSGENSDRSKSKFSWEVYGDRNDSLYQLTKSYINLLEDKSIGYPTVHIGITGLNNVGKSALARCLRDKLAIKYKVTLIDDRFKTHLVGTGVSDNLKIIIGHLVEKSIKSVDICIHDRSIVDDYCFYLVRSKDEKNLGAHVSPLIAKAAERLSLSIDVRKRDENYASTSLVTSDERRAIRLKLDDFFKKNNLNKTEVEINHLDFTASISDVADSVLPKIIALLNLQKISP